MLNMRDSAARRMSCDDDDTDAHYETLDYLRRNGAHRRQSCNPHFAVGVYQPWSWAAVNLAFAGARSHIARTSILCALLVLPPCHACAADAVGSPNFFGLLPVRDMTPFGLVRLDMRQSPATFSTSQRPSIEFDVGYQSIWALSDGVEQYLQSRPRSSLTQTDIAKIRALPGEQFLTDAEVALLDVTFNYPFTNRFSTYAILSAASYHGGWMDGVIENFHSAFGFEQSGRPGLTRKQVNLLYDLKGIQYTEVDRPSDRGLLDPVLGLRYGLMPTPNSINVVLDAAIKVPLGGDILFSTGHVDVGAQITAQYYTGRHAFYASGALVYYSGSPAPFNDSSQIVPTGIVGYEFRWLQHTNLIAQFYVSRSTMRGEQTDLDDLRSNKYQVSLGVRQRLQRGYVSAAFTENIRHYKNTPDFGFQISAGLNL